MYREIWRIVDGCIVDTLNAHPDYVAPGRAMTIRTSLAKRITGAVMGFAGEAAKGRDTNERERSQVGVLAEMQSRATRPALIGRVVRAIKARVATTTRATAHREVSP